MLYSAQSYKAVPTAPDVYTAMDESAVRRSILTIGHGVDCDNILIETLSSSSYKATGFVSVSGKKLVEVATALELQAVVSPVRINGDCTAIQVEFNPISASSAEEPRHYALSEVSGIYGDVSPVGQPIFVRVAA